MLDINFIINNSDEIKYKLECKGYKIDFTDLLQWHKLRKSLLYKIILLNIEKNKFSNRIDNLINNKIEFKKQKLYMKEISNQKKKLTIEVKQVSTKIDLLLEKIPNIPDSDICTNTKNQILNVGNLQPEFNFIPKDHMDIAKMHDLIDYKRGAKISGNSYWIYKNKGALLEWALINYCIQAHIKNGYEFILPPHIVYNKCGYIAGQFPKFINSFQINMNSKNNIDSDYFLIPTSETVLISMHENEIFEENVLPIKYFSYTPCYRKESGGYRTSEKGILRGHQFNKVELFQLTRPEDSENAFEELLHISEKLIKDLGLHYRVTKLSAKNCAFAMAKTYDIEVWIPSINSYKEVSSCSNSRDYQPRRGNIKFYRKSKNKNEFVHSLNASSLATSRLFPAILETYQQKDGSIIIPEKLINILNIKEYKL